MHFAPLRGSCIGILTPGLMSYDLFGSILVAFYGQMSRVGCPLPPRSYLFKHCSCLPGLIVVSHLPVFAVDTNVFR